MGGIVISREIRRSNSSSNNRCAREKASGLTY